MPYFSCDDIAQIGSPPGRGLVGILRLSGANALAIASRLLVGVDDLFSTRRRGCGDGFFRLSLNVHNGTERPEVRVRRCPARVFVMPAPASYTREDVVEIHLPGSPAVVRAGLAALAAAGARPAAPGEFTFRAFRNGRLGLAQAEAVEETIRAANAGERRRALSRLGDPLSGKILAWRDKAMDMAARIEAALDFDEEELGEDPAAELAGLLDELRADGVRAGETAAGSTEELPEVALVGLANAGKSSLYNALLAENAALVSEEPSTTRDALRREANWSGVGFRLSDNPGYDPDNASAGGVAAELAMRRLGGAAANCWIADASRPPDAALGDFARRLPGRAILVLNKSDLENRLTESAFRRLAEANGVDVQACVAVSARTGAGLDRLRAVVAARLPGSGNEAAPNRREALELANAMDGCVRAREALLSGSGLELAAEELRAALSAFSRALGEGYAEDALLRIFSRFCLGK